MMLLGRVEAGLDLLGRTGVSDVELAYDDDGPLSAPVQWWCGGNWSGARRFSERFPYPAQAVEDLLGRVVNGGSCVRYGKTTVVGIIVPGFCCLTVEAVDLDETGTYRYGRACEKEAGSGAG